MTQSIHAYAGFGTPEDSNARNKFLLDHGATALCLALDLPTQVGYDSDDPRAKGEVGKVGVSLSSLKDVEALFEGIPLNKLDWVFTAATAIGPIALSWFIALGEKQGISPRNYTIRLQNDPFREYTGRGAYFLPIEPAFRLSQDATEYSVRNFPHWRPLWVCSAQIRSAGVDNAYEIGYLLSAWYDYAKGLSARGLNIDQFAGSIELHPICDNKLLEEVAKLRALKICWKKLVKEKMGVKDPSKYTLWVHGVSYPYTFTRPEPLNNIVRLTIGTLASHLAGCQDYFVPAPDEVIGVPSAESQLMSLRIRQIIVYESGFLEVADVLHGSDYLEGLTSELVQRGWEQFNQFEASGGALTNIKGGKIQWEAAEQDYKRQKEIDRGEKIIIGLNRFPLSPTGKSLTMERFQVNPDAESIQVEKLKQLKRERDNIKVRKALAELDEAVRNGVNIIPQTLQAVKAYATIGEICSVWRSIFGEYREPPFAL